MHYYIRSQWMFFILLLTIKPRTLFGALLSKLLLLYLTLAMDEDTGFLSSLIFTASMGFPTMTGGREIGSEIMGIMPVHSGLMFIASYTKPSATQPLNVLNFRAMDNSLVQIWC